MMCDFNSLLAKTKFKGFKNLINQPLCIQVRFLVPKYSEHLHTNKTLQVFAKKSKWFMKIDSETFYFGLSYTFLYTTIILLRFTIKII